MSFLLMKRTPVFEAVVVLVVTLAVAGLVAAAPLARPALAATFTVDRNDDPDPTTANACTAAANDCSLRGAIIAANAAAGADAITVPAGTYTLTIVGAGEDAASTGDLDVTDDLTVTGAGARTTSVAGGAAPFDDTIFENRPDATATITGLTITGGKAGGGGGGGVRNEGNLTLDGVAVKGNTADLSGIGGGIYGDGGTLNLTDSTVSGNSATAAGGLYQQGSGTANITNSTISGNRAAQGQFSGGVVAAGGALVSILNSTIASNTSGRPGGGILTTLGSTVFVKNTIVAGNTLGNCDNDQLGGAISSRGNNMSSDGSCNFTKPTDKQNINPRLGPLQNNGGPTDTRALLAGSPAIDTGANTACPTADQRGVRRPQGTTCDIGAFERRNSAPVAGNDAYKGKEDRTLTRSASGVLRNDTDPDGDALRATLVSGPKKGKLSLKPSGAFTYKPKKDFNGTDRFVYRASDGRGGSDTAVVTIRIKGQPG